VERKIEIKGVLLFKIRRMALKSGVFISLSLYCCTRRNTVLNEKSGISFCSKLLRFHRSAGNEGDVSTLRSHQRAFRGEEPKIDFVNSAKKRKLKAKTAYICVCVGVQSLFSEWNSSNSRQPQEIALSGRLRSRPQFFQAANATLPTHQQQSLGS
jgi:hypothetical protein